MNSAAKISSRKVYEEWSDKQHDNFITKQKESSDIQYQICETYMKSYEQPQNDGLWRRGNMEGDRWSYEVFNLL